MNSKELTEAGSLMNLDQPIRERDPVAFENLFKTELFVSLTELIDIYSKWDGKNELTIEIIKDYQKDLEEEIWFNIYQNCLDIKLIQFLDLLFETPSDVERNALIWLTDDINTNGSDNQNAAKVKLNVGKGGNVNMTLMI